jgi:hypothetical protein
MHPPLHRAMLLLSLLLVNILATLCTVKLPILPLLSLCCISEFVFLQVAVL